MMGQAHRQPLATGRFKGRGKAFLSFRSAGITVPGARPRRTREPSGAPAATAPAGPEPRRAAVGPVQGGPAAGGAGPGMGCGRLAGAVCGRRVRDGRRGHSGTGRRPGGCPQRDRRAGQADSRPGEAAGRPRGLGQGRYGGRFWRWEHQADDDPRRSPSGLGQVRGRQGWRRPRRDQEEEAGSPTRPPGVGPEGPCRPDRRVPPGAVRALRQGGPEDRPDRPQDGRRLGRGPAEDGPDDVRDPDWKVPRVRRPDRSAHRRHLRDVLRASPARHPAGLRAGPQHRGRHAADAQGDRGRVILDRRHL